MPDLNKASILAAHDVRIIPVEVPEWGGSVYVRTFSGRVRDSVDRFIASRLDAAGRLVDPSGLRIAVVIASACDKDGKLLFSPEDAPALEDKSAEALDRIFLAAKELNGMGGADADPTEAKKN